MSSAATLLASASPAPARDRFDPVRVAFLLIIHSGAAAALWYTTWPAVAVCFLLHAVMGGMGMCVGYHRLLTHRSFKCSRPLEYLLTLLGALCMQGGPVEWVSQHRQHHYNADQPGDPHSARQGFWWSHVLWILWAPSKESSLAVARRYAPDLLQVPLYRRLGRVHTLPSVVLAGVLYLVGGWPFVVWGICVRLVLTYHCTWLVNSASHTFGYRTFAVDDLSTNCWWVALLSYGEGWHNNHHAFPTSARHGLLRWELDPAYGFIRLLQSLRLAWDLRRPPADRLGFNQRRPLAAT